MRDRLSILKDLQIVSGGFFYPTGSMCDES